MKQNWKLNLIGGISFTTMLFVFQACYGTPQDLNADVYIEGIVRSATTGNAIKGIKVSVIDFPQYSYSDEAGKFSFYTALNSTIGLKFEDVDSTQNGAYYTKDTILKNPSDTVVLNVSLQEK